MSDRALRRLALRVLLPGFAGLVHPPWLLDLVGDGLAGVVLFERNVDPRQPDAGVAALTARLRGARGDVLVGIDEEGGDVSRLDAARGSRVPGAAALGHVDDAALTRRVGRAVGERLAAAGVRLDLAPVADVHADDRNPVIGVRSFGADPALVARHVAATIAGLHDAGVAATAKHFPGHGATREDSHLTLPVLGVDRATLAGRELVPFAAAVEAGVDAVMTAHVHYPCLDDVPATLSPRVVGDLLRGELGFDGVVMSDGLDMHAITRTVGRPEGAVRALAAGVDALCLGGQALEASHIEHLATAIADAVAAGRISEARLVDAAARVGALARRVSDVPPMGADADAGAVAARRALTVHGVVALRDAPVVVELLDSGTIPAGDAPFAIGASLRDRLPATQLLPLRPGDGDPPVLADRAALASRGRPLVVSARHTTVGTWARQVLDALVTVRPDLVLVDHGRPGTGLACRRIETWSGSRVSADAASDLLAGR